MIACNCCPTPEGCKDSDTCLNALVVQRQRDNWPFPTWHNGKIVTPVVWNAPSTARDRHRAQHSTPAKPASGDGWRTDAWNSPPPVKPACWHAYAPAAGPIGAIVSARTCLHWGQPEF